MSSKVSLNTLYQAVWEVLPENQCKWRNFLETVELQISLKNCDPQKDKHFPGTIRLKSAPVDDSFQEQGCKGLGPKCQPLHPLTAQSHLSTPAPSTQAEGDRKPGGW
uniref:Uncharacterized protein n=2 Tax=Sus scrofa TaxID=9823 RepID=A0A8D0XWA5_PIG